LRDEPIPSGSTVDSKAGTKPRNQFSTGGIWISKAELASKPTSGSAWRRLKDAADRDAGVPNIKDQQQMNNVYVLAKALVYARTGRESYRTEVRAQCMAAIGTEVGGRTLALGRELAAYVIAADLVGLEADEDLRFRSWLRSCLSEDLAGLTLRSTHEKRPNNWGTHAGASRAAVAAYLGDRIELDRTAKVFRGWLGDRRAYTGFHFGNTSWQFNVDKPVGINKRGAMKDGHSIDGVLPDDQRRSGEFLWPPPQENYVYEGLQGAIVQAVILSRAGYDVWNWSDQAMLRAYEWLAKEAVYPASGDDKWQMPVIEYYYHPELWHGGSVSCGKNMAWTDWTHGS
jgi:hypothetical protein